MNVFVLTNTHTHIQIQLKDIIQESLVLDIRTNTDFNKLHLAGAYSLQYPFILMKRILKTYKNLDFSIDKYILDDEDPLKKRHSATSIVLYNENGVINPEMMMYMDILSREMPSRVVSYVYGGFNAIVQNGSYTLQSNDIVEVVKPIQPIEQEDSTRDFNYIDKNICTTPLINRSTNIAIGAETVAHNQELVRAEGFTHILNVSSTCHYSYSDIIYLWKQISDRPNQTLFNVLPECVMFIDSAVTNNGKILVHCQAGISRSVSMVIAYYMWSCKMSYNEAITMIQKQRDKISPNIGFIGQLLTFELYLKETNYNLAESCKLAAEKLKLLSL